MGAGSSGLVRASPRQHYDAGHQDVTATANIRPDAWADLDHTLRAGSVARTKERIQCICEGGHHCESEDPSCQKAHSPFQGLHASWVTTKVLAMARPWQENLVAHKLPEALQAAGVGMILNLQEVGEHAHCGRGILPASGFSYNPEAFMAADIGVYNFSWKDMGVPTLFKMMDIVQVMVHVIQEQQRKIAVHCHAGLGRTGLAIACYLVFLGECDAHNAILRVRQGRPGALQTQQQEHFVQVFQVYLVHLRCVFPTSNAASAHMPTASASARSQLADLHSGSSTPSKAASRPAHRLQVQSTPSTAEASVHGQENLQEASPTSGAAGPVAARPDAAEPDAEEPVTAGPDVAGPETAEPDPARPDAAELNPPGPDAAGLSADTVEGVPGEDSCDAAEREAAHTVADVQSMASCSITKTDDASRLAAARPRLRGLRLPWLDNQAGHRPEQVHGHDAVGGMLYRTESLWSKEGLIRAGSRQNIRKKQVFRASPPTDLAEALDRQRRLLHGQDLRNYWNLPKVVGVIAAALEQHAAHSVLNQHGPLSVGMQAASGVSETTAAQQADPTACAASANNDVSAITMEVNAGKWEGLQAVSPSVLMQLLQRWFQAFAQPVLSAAQQTAMLAALDMHNGTAAASISANNASQDTGVKQAAVGDLMSQRELPGAASQCSTEACAAAICHLPMTQTTLIRRIVKCIVAVTEQDQDGSSRQMLMQWLATVLTKPYQLGTNSVPSIEQQALLSALEYYASRSSSSTVQTLHATPLKPALIGLVVTAAEHVATSDGSQTQTVVNQLDACATAGAPLSVAAESQAGPYDETAAHMPNTSAVEVGREPPVLGKPDCEVEHSVEDGCMWFHKRVARGSIGRFR